MTPVNVNEAIAKLNELEKQCLDAIRRQGAHARIIFRIPGKWGKHSDKRMYPGGPMGKIVSVTHDREKVLVLFEAADTLTKLEETKNAIIASRFGSGEIDELNTGLRMGADGQESHRDTDGAHNKKGVGQGSATCVVSAEPNVLFKL